MEAYAGGRQKTSSDNFDDLDLERPSTKPIDPEELDDNDLRHKLITPLGQQKKTTAIKINLHTDSRKLAETKPPIPPPLPKLPPHTPNFIPLGFSPLGHPPPPPLRLPHMNPLGGHMGSSLGLPFGAPIGLNLAPPLGFSLNPLPPRGVLPGSHIIAPTPVEIVEQPKKEDKPKLPAAAVDKQEKLKELRQTLAITIYQAAELDKHSYRGPLFKRTTSNPNLFLCHICNIKVLNNDVVNHHKGKKHTSNLASVEIVNLKSDKEVDPKEPEIPGVESVIREVPLCQAMLDAFIDSPLIGLEYLVELLDKEDENCHVVCFLCDKRGESLMQNVRQNIISHMIGTTHRMNYLKRHFPRAHEALIGVQNSKDLKLETGRFVRLVIEAIEKEYGRLKPILADSRTFRVRCNEYKELTENAKHFSETPTKTFTELIGPIKRSPSVECVELSPVRRVRRSRSPNRRARSRSPSIRWNSSPGRSTSPGRSRSSEQRRSPVRRRGQSYRSNVRREKSISLSPEGGSSRMSPFDERIQCRKESATFDEESGQEVVEIHPNGSTGPQFGPMAVIVEDYGRTHLAKKLGRFLNWTGHQAKGFTMQDENLKWFENKRLAQSPAEFEDICNWLSKGGPAIAVIECSSTTERHRPELCEMLTNCSKECRVLFVECICDETCDKMNSAGKRKSPTTPTSGTSAQSKTTNGPNPQISCIRVCGADILARYINGHLQSHVLSFVSSVVSGTRTIYFSRHGESENNVLGRIGGDTDLSPRGKCYARILAREINAMEIQDLRVLTSQLKRTQQTAAFIKATMESLEALNELEAGVCEGLTYEEMQEKHPTEFAWRDQDKLRYRYPWGESYVDIMARVTPVIMELERTSNVLIVSHQAVLRCLVGYFLGKQPDELPYLDVPLHTIMKLTTDGNASTFDLIRLPIECVDTYRQKPQNCSVHRKQEDALRTVPSHYESSINFGLLEH
ncbi:uncharacterized protein LOC135940280 isoform X3 [Cloeon dipterum]|uniref:uncharacterized protein LOC135940280 isoform X3 n=1 Tax=Cloeon dipterum TaxID=197152 RepID=UPI0032209F92